MATSITTRFACDLHSRKRENAPTPLADLFRDPVLRAIFRRAERDNGAAFAVPTPKSPVLSGGAVVKPSRVLVLA